MKETASISMATLILPAHVRSAMKSVAQVAAEVPIHKVFEQAILFLFGEIEQTEIKTYARKAGVQFPTYQESIDALAWIVCEAVRTKCTTDNFREFIAEIDFLNTKQVLAVYEKAMQSVKETLVENSPDTEHFVSLDWRLQVEIGRRALRSMRRPHVVVNIKTTKQTETLKITPQGLVELYTTFDAALQACRTSKFRRIQRFIK